MGSSSTSTGTMLLSNPQMNSLVYWDNPRDSGIVCGSLLVCLLAVRYISLISVIGNLSLALVTATMSFRIYKSVLAAVNKNQEGHPFKAFLDVDIRIPEAQLTAAVENAGARINGLLAALKAAILVENIVEYAKFAVGMYLVSYLGKLMTGLTLVTLVWAGIFSLPRIYKDNQAKIDEALMPLLTKYEAGWQGVRGLPRLSHRQEGGVEHPFLQLRLHCLQKKHLLLLFDIYMICLTSI